MVDLVIITDAKNAFSQLILIFIDYTYQFSHFFLEKKVFFKIDLPWRMKFWMKLHAIAINWYSKAPELMRPPNSSMSGIDSYIKNAQLLTHFACHFPRSSRRWGLAVNVGNIRVVVDVDFVVFNFSVSMFRFIPLSRFNKQLEQIFHCVAYALCQALFVTAMLFQIFHAIVRCIHSGCKLFAHKVIRKDEHEGNNGPFFHRWCNIKYPFRYSENGFTQIPEMCCW